MFQKTTTAFRKNVNCPSSEQLLTYLQERTGAGQRSAIAVHLSICDFCSAEVEFYRHCSSAPDEEVAPSMIPEHLYQLARALLRKDISKDLELNALAETRPDGDNGLR